MTRRTLFVSSPIGLGHARRDPRAPHPLTRNGEAGCGRIHIDGGRLVPCAANDTYVKVPLALELGDWITPPVDIGGRDPHAAAQAKTESEIDATPFRRCCRARLAS